MAQSEAIQQTEAIEYGKLLDVVKESSIQATQKLNQLQSRKSSVSVVDIFDFQMTMQKFTQMTELSSTVVSSSNTSINSMLRALKS